MSWETGRLGDYAKVISGYAFKSADFKSSGGIPVIKIKNIQTEQVDFSETYFLPNEFLTIDPKFHVNKDDILISLTGSNITLPNSVVGRIARYTYDFTSLLNQRAGKIIPYSKEHLDNRFLYYYLCNWEVRREIALFGQGGANQCNISPGNVESIDIPLPPLPTQQKIASILSAYDDLIENNLKRIRLLEEAAQNIYKEWFVHFRFPGWEKAEFVDGMVKGWERKKLGDMINLVHGYAFESKQFVEETTPIMVIRMGNFKEGGGLQLNRNVKYISKDYQFKDKYKLVAGDLLIVLSDVTREGRIIGNVGILPDYGIEYVLNQRVAKLVCDESLKPYLYASLNSEGFKDHCRPRANGATVLNLKTADVTDYEMIIPKLEIINQFSRIYQSYLLQLENFDIQNQKLKEARDILLPRLMNRTIEV